MNFYKISDFARISGLSEKTLRYYHDEEILVPD
jgi:DNA-binding transcriptional MerR regulator